MGVLFPFLAVLADPKLRETAEANVGSFSRAILSRDVGYFDRTFAPGFVQRVEGKPMNRDAALGQIRKGLLKMHLNKLTSTVGTVKPYGKGLVATVRFVGEMKGNVQGMPATLSATWTDDQTWIPSPNGWRLLALSTHGFKRSVALDK